MISPKVYALGECKDYLEYVTTKDTIAYTNGVQTYDIKEGTEFKMCFQAGSDAIIRLNDDITASYIEKGSYKLKEEFNIEKAHAMNDCELSVNANSEVYSDPSGINKIGDVKNDLLVKGDYYYGPYVYISDNRVNGWIYTEGLTRACNNNKLTEENVDTNKNEKEEIIIDNTSSDKSKTNTNTKYTVLITILSVIIISLMVSLILIKKKQNNTETDNRKDL